MTRRHVFTFQKLLCKVSPLGSGGPSALAEWAALVRGAGAAHGEGNCSPWVCAWLSLWHLCKTDEAWLSPQGAVTPKGGTGMSTVHMWPQARENVLINVFLLCGRHCPFFSGRRISEMFPGGPGGG